jgi:hypothetical protein
MSRNACTLAGCGGAVVVFISIIAWLIWEEVHWGDHAASRLAGRPVTLNEFERRGSRGSSNAARRSR